jgi:hypothetical protein
LRWNINNSGEISGIPQGAGSSAGENLRSLLGIDCSSNAKNKSHLFAFGYTGRTDDAQPPPVPSSSITLLAPPPRVSVAMPKEAPAVSKQPSNKKWLITTQISEVLVIWGFTHRIWQHHPNLEINWDSGCSTAVGM